MEIFHLLFGNHGISSDLMVAKAIASDPFSLEFLNVTNCHHEQLLEADWPERRLNNTLCAIARIPAEIEPT